ncbi:hypothetical protein ACLB2K_040748 [Fragaria x ananassa]
MVPSPQVPTRESRGDGGDVPETCWQEDKFNVALASQSALGWGLSRGGHLRLVGDCREVASQFALDWGLRLMCPRLVGDCREVASQSALDWGLRLMWRVSPRLVGDCREVASQSAFDWGLRLCREAVHAWLGTVAK